MPHDNKAVPDYLGEWYYLEYEDLLKEAEELAF
jgi:hypothetical protein